MKKLVGRKVIKVIRGRPLNAGGEELVDVANPTITSADAVSWPEGSTLNHALTASEAVTWTKVGGADTALFTLVGSTLTLGSQNFESPADVGSNNTYVVTVRATDAATNFSEQTITVTITNVAEVTLAPLTLDDSSVVEGTAQGIAVGNLVGVSSGSVLAMTDTAGGRFQLNGSAVECGAVATDFGTATSHNITIRETHTDGTNTPRDSIIVITVTEDVGGGGGDGLLDFSDAAQSQYLAVLEDF